MTDPAPGLVLCLVLAAGWGLYWWVVAHRTATAHRVALKVVVACAAKLDDAARALDHSGKPMEAHRLREYAAAARTDAAGPR